MRTFLIFSCVLSLASWPLTHCHAQQAGGRPPNIIFILADDQGYGDLGAFFQNARTRDSGKPAERSPHLDRLAGEGAMLSQYYCAAPICAPSRASLMLGVSQGHSNVRDNEFDKALDDNYTLPSTLRTLGYTTAIIGKWGLEGNDKYDLNGYLWPAYPLKRGFDYFFGYIHHSDGHEHYPKEALYRKYWAETEKVVWQNYTNMTPGLDKCYTADLWTAAAKKYIIDHTGKSAKPFFLYLAFDTPHAVQELPTGPYPAGGGLHGGLRWLGRKGHWINTATGTPDSYTHPDYEHATYDADSNASTPDVPWPETYKRYATANRRIDDAVGDIVQLLKDLKIDGNTLIVYTSDNGPSNESYLPEDRFPPNRPTFFASYGPFEGIKADTWEGGVHLPAIAWWPGHVAPGKKITLPAIAYDWAPTFIDLAGKPAPERMDGISLRPVLTGKGVQRNPLVYVEYKGEESTPDYKEFAEAKRGRLRGQTQMLRLGDYTGLRYNIRSANDDFEIYNVAEDPKQLHNLAHDSTRTLHLGDGHDTNIGAFQVMLKERVLQVRHPDAGSPRPYDSALVPPVSRAGLTPGLRWQLFAGSFPWIPQTWGLEVKQSGRLAIPETVPADSALQTLTVFTGYIKVPSDGLYSFYMACDAKAFLRIHDIQVIDEDYGYPGSLLRTGTVLLKAGLHPFRLSYYRREDQGPPFLKLDWSGPGFNRQKMPKSSFFTE